MDRKNTIVSEHADLYREIGRFVVKFENAVEIARRCIDYSISGARNDPRNIQVLLAEVTATPIFKSLRSIVFHLFEKRRPEEIRAIDPFLIYCQKMCEVRNRIVHGCWYIEYYSIETAKNEAQDEIVAPVKEALFHKHNNTKKGLDFGIGVYSVDTIAKYADACKEMEELLLLLNAVIVSADLSFTFPNIQKRISDLPPLEFPKDGSFQSDK